MHKKKHFRDFSTDVKLCVPYLEPFHKSFIKIPLNLILGYHTKLKVVLQNTSYRLIL